MIDCTTKYYEIVIENPKNGLKLYHIGGNITFNTPTEHRGKAKVYYSLAGAKQGLRAVKKRLGGDLKAYITSFYDNIEED